MTTIEEIGPLVGPILFLGFLAWMIWALRRRGRSAAHRQAADAPEGTPYHIYTKDFDRVVSARDVPDVMVKANLGVPPGLPPNVQTWPARKAAVKRIAENARPAFASAEALTVPILEKAQGDLALMVLIDQSGSMRANILAVAASARWLSKLFDKYAVPLSIAGFTTAGWRGGAARRKWIAAGRPKRPGRLCALLHIRYRDFDGTLADEDFEAMVHPFALCENIDGEAIQWAAGELERRRERRKLLIVLSDGAPVDDSTLMENGPNFLLRHIRDVIANVSSESDIQLGAIGIEYRVHEFYASSTDATDLDRIPHALALQIGELAAAATKKGAEQ